MSYLGNAPARSFISFERQVFTIVNSQTAYTLSHSVTNENDIRLVVNNVVQEPGSGKAYTASGTTLTLSAALTNGTDEMYCVFLGRAVGTVNAPAGSVGTSQLVDLNVTTGKIAADAITNAKIADDAISDEQLDPTVITGQTAETSIATDDLILLSDTSASGALKKMTRANFVSGVGGVNTPAFLASSTGEVTVANATNVLINNYSVEILDTDSCYNTTNSRFTPNVAGYYSIFAIVASYPAYTANNFNTILAKNGTAFAYTSSYTTQYPQQETVGMVYLNGSSDYVEVYCYQDSGSSRQVDGGTHRIFGGFKIIQ